MWAVFKKELKSYFLSPIGYVVIGLFLFIFSCIFYFTTINVGAYDMGYLYAYTAIFAVPFMAGIIAMRMFAEERKSGTEQLLLTSPISITKIVLGKYLAAVALIAITLVCSLMYYIILCFFGAPNLTVTLVAILGFLLLCMAAIAFGMFISTLTENQVIAAIVTIVILFLPIILAVFFGINLPIFNLINSYQKFQLGMISIKELVSLLSFATVFILTTIIIMQRRKSVK